MIRCSILMHSHGGGAEQVALTLARHLDSTCVGVKVYSMRHIPALAVVIPQGVSFGMPSRPGVWAAFIYIWQVWRAVRRSSVVLGSLELQSIFWAALLAPGKAVGWLHKDVEGYLRGKGWLYAVIYRGLLGWALRRCARGVCVSQGVLESTARLWPDVAPRLRVLWNPVNVDALHARAQSLLPPELTAIFSQPVILGVGRLEQQKAFEDLLLAHRELVWRGVVHHMCILGEGSQRPQLERLIRQYGLENTAFLPGFYDPCPCMARSRVLAMSSCFEGLPTVLIEALAIGLPVVSTDCPSGPREVLCAGQFGTLVPMNDIKGMADALQRLLEHDADPQLCAAGQGRAQDFSLPKTLQAWQTLLQEVAAISPAQPPA